MVDAIITGRDPVIPLPNVRHTLEWALAMYSSAKAQAPVTLPIVDEDEIWESPTAVPPADLPA